MFWRQNYIRLQCQSKQGIGARDLYVISVPPGSRPPSRPCIPFVAQPLETFWLRHCFADILNSAIPLLSFQAPSSIHATITVFLLLFVMGSHGNKQFGVNRKSWTWAFKVDNIDGIYVSDML